MMRRILRWTRGFPDFQIWGLRLTSLFRKPIFWSITLLVHGLLLAGAYLFHLAEATENTRIHSFLDSFFWAVATVTTVGYGDIIPVTTLGRWIAIGMMLLGSVFSVTYTTLFVAALLAPELKHIEEETRHLEQQLLAERNKPEARKRREHDAKR